MAGFDPYHKWLGIPPEEQPANHYRLLGLAPFEEDADVIDAAVNRNIAYLQDAATGQHIKESQALINEITQVRLCLLNEEKKSAYDSALRAKEAAAVAAGESSIFDDLGDLGAFGGPLSDAGGLSTPSLSDASSETLIKSGATTDVNMGNSGVGLPVSTSSALSGKLPKVKLDASTWNSIPTRWKLILGVGLPALLAATVVYLVVWWNRPPEREPDDNSGTPNSQLNIAQNTGTQNQGAQNKGAQQGKSEEKKQAPKGEPKKAPPPKPEGNNKKKATPPDPVPEKGPKEEEPKKVDEPKNEPKNEPKVESSGAADAAAVELVVDDTPAYAKGFVAFEISGVKSDNKRTQFDLDTTDQSLLVSGSVLKSEEYSVYIATKLSGITAIKIECLPDDRLPNSGPGRARGGNYAISEVSLEEYLKNDIAIGSVRVVGDSEATEHLTTKMIDGSLSSNWPCKVVGAKTGIILIPETPIVDMPRLELTISNYSKYALGSFRVLGTTMPITDLPQ